MRITLTAEELALLLRAAASPEEDGGYYPLLSRLQAQVDRGSGALNLSSTQLQRIARYGNDFGVETWERTLHQVFERSLGHSLEGSPDRQPL